MLFYYRTKVSSFLLLEHIMSTILSELLSLKVQVHLLAIVSVLELVIITVLHIASKVKKNTSLLGRFRIVTLTNVYESEKLQLQKIRNWKKTFQVIILLIHL